MENSAAGVNIHQRSDIHHTYQGRPPPARMLAGAAPSVGGNVREKAGARGGEDAPPATVQHRGPSTNQNDPLSPVTRSALAVAWREKAQKHIRAKAHLHIEPSARRRLSVRLERAVEKGPLVIFRNPETGQRGA